MGHHVLNNDFVKETDSVTDAVVVLPCVETPELAPTSTGYSPLG
jgi:hypothetical protein